MLPNVDYIKTVVNGLKQWVGNRVNAVRRELVDKVEELPQADWNQNDPDAKDYIKNRICYEEVVEQWKQLTFDNYAGAGFLQTSGLVVTFRVDGVIYEDVAGEWHASSTAMYFQAGDYTISVEYRGKKINCWPTPSSLLFFNKSNVIHQIDDKFIAIKNDNLRNGPKAGSIIAAGYAYDVEQVGDDSFAVGLQCLASGDRACATGYYTAASGDNSHAEGTQTKAVGYSSHAEGYASEASGKYAHTEGDQSKATGNSAHAEGGYTTASGRSSHAEGEDNKAIGTRAHAEGYYTSAEGVDSHAEGSDTTALGDRSHAEGDGTIATRVGSHVEGSYNVKDEAKTYIHIVGNGTSSSKRSNAHTLDGDGNAWYSGDVYVGSTGGTNRDGGSKKLATEDYVNAAVAAAGETWELIGEATCAEDAQSFIMDKDADGNPFALKEIAIITYSPAFTGDTTSYGRGLGLYPGTGWGNQQVQMTNAPMAKNNEVARYEMHYFKMYGGGMRLIRRWQSQNSTHVRHVLMPMNNAGDAPIGFVLGAEDPFTLSGTEFSGPATCVKIAGYMQQAVSAGTKVKVWGVRA